MGGLFMGKRHSPEQIVRMLRQAEARLAAGATVPEAARELGISEATFHRWRNHYGAMSTSEAKRLKELEKENARLKKLLAEQALDIDILKEVSRETSEPDPEESRRRARWAAARSFRASGVQGDRSAQIKPALRGQQDAKGPRSGRADGSALAGESPLRLQAGVGAAEEGRLAGQQEAGASAVARGRTQSTRQATQKAAPPDPRPERERVHEEAG